MQIKKSHHNSKPQSTFLLRPHHIILQQLLSSALSANYKSIISSTFTSNSCSSHSYQNLSNNNPNHITTSYKRQFKYSSSSPNFSDQLQLDDAGSIPTINITTPLEIQRLVTIDSKKQQNHIQSTHRYQYDSSFHSSDSDIYALNEPVKQNPQYRCHQYYLSSTLLQ